MVSYATISAAVAAVAPNTTVLVCPGTYPEQVTITQPLTLEGLTGRAGAKAIITVPSGGLTGNYPAQLSVQTTDASSEFGPVDISNLIIDGSGSGFNCINGYFTGIEYMFASGTLSQVEVRNQKPGGCGFGITVIGSPWVVDTVNIQKSNIHNFDDTGILASSGGETGFLVNLNSNKITSTSASVSAGVDYEFTDGLAEYNNIVLAGGIGLHLNNFYGGMTAYANTISKAYIGILSNSNEGTPTIISQNNLLNNGIGIFIGALNGSDVVNSNTIVQSGIAAIQLDCSSQTTSAKQNIIYGAPVGIANVNSGDTITQNVFYSVPTTTTWCP
jgi:hypothetical protein